MAVIFLSSLAEAVLQPSLVGRVEVMHAKKRPRSTHCGGKGCCVICLLIDNGVVVRRFMASPLHQDGGKIMSIDSAKAFKTRFLEDKEFQQRFLALATAAERQSFLQSEGFDFTPEELAQVRQELSDDELAAVAGGKCCGRTCERDGCGKAHRLL